MAKVYVITKQTEERDWGRISFDIVGVWPTIEMDKEALTKIKKDQDDLNKRHGDGNTAAIYCNGNDVTWHYSDWDGCYDYSIERTVFHDSQ